MKKTILFLLKILLLTIILFVCMAASSILMGMGQTFSSSSSDVMPVLMYSLLVYSLLNVLILTVWIENSRLRGIRLAVVCFTVFWGVQYFMTQIETLFFNSAVKMPVSEVFRVSSSGALYTAVFSMLAVWILGKFKKENARNEITGEKAARFALLPNLAVLTLTYVVIYFLFGYFVAWQFPVIRQFYTGSTQIVNFFQHMAGQSPFLILFQLFRGILWALLALLILNSLKVKNRASYLIPGLLFSILISAPLLLPNAYMPDAVRFGHTIELFSSMLTYGILSVPILKKRSSGSSKINALSQG
ncbi:MAG TPA: hypothetical protein VHR42_06160 [Clostridia bacterium]|nr:hypothetical protein [Clostridia bacterium]